MSTRKIFCPNCGEQILLDINRAFFFCPECGEKIVLMQPQSKTQIEQDRDSQTSSVIEQRLKEVAFFYQTSAEKEEAQRPDEDPTYYLKAQDLLLDLSEEYPGEYKIWWELCKPLDFCCASTTADADNRLSINEHYFNKALDCAELDVKKQLIEEHDRYVTEKKAAVDELILGRKREEQRQKQQIEKKRRTALGYTSIDGSFFKIPQSTGQPTIGIFRYAANMFYLISIRLDNYHKDTPIREQTIPIQFNSNGQVVKYDNTPVTLVGVSTISNTLIVTVNENGDYLLNGAPLRKDLSYVNNIMRAAKKEVFSSKRTFL